jgi:multidrug efflux pump subunit AcrB
MNPRSRLGAIAALACLALAAGCREAAAPALAAPAKAGRVVQITATYPAADAPVVLEQVAAPILQQVNGVAGQTRLEAEAHTDGTFLVRVFLEPDGEADVAEANTAAALVQKRVALAEPLLPELVRKNGIEVQLLNQPVGPPRLTLVLYDRSNAPRAALQSWARAVAQRLAASGVTVAATPDPMAKDLPRVRVVIDRERAARLGVETSAAEGVLRAAGPNATPEMLQQEEVPTTSGERLPLASIATIEQVTVPAVICHYDQWECYYFRGPIPAGQTAAATAAAWQAIAEQAKPADSAGDLGVVTYESP